MEPLLRNFRELSKGDVGLAGGKGASLGEMTQAGIPVPPGFVILSVAFEKFIEETGLAAEIEAILDSVNHEEIHTVEGASEKIQALITAAEMPTDLKAAITASFKDLGAKYVAVRSSATAEDSASAAWAGQLDSYLNTPATKLLENVKHCWASLFTPRAIFYRFEQNLRRQKISVAVVVQKMVESEVSGIAFSVHPVTQDRNQLIIEASYGLGEAIVSGQVTPDSYVLEKQPRRIVEKMIQTKSRGLYRSAQNGNEWKNTPQSKADQQALSDEQILELTKLILHIEGHYAFPCDIEWALEKGSFYILQSRPITTLSSGGGMSKDRVEGSAETSQGYTFDRALEQIKTKKNWYNKSFSGYLFGIAQQGLGIARGEKNSPYAIPYGLLFQDHNKMDHFDWFWNGELMAEKRTQILNKAQADAKFAKEFYKTWKRTWDAFLKQWEQAVVLDFSSMTLIDTRKKLASLHETVVEQTSYGYVVDAFLNDDEHDWLKKIIEDELEAAATPEVIAALTAPAYESFVNAFEFRKLEIAEQIHRGESEKALLAACRAVEEDFFWIRVNYRSYARLTAEAIYCEVADEAEKLGEVEVVAKLKEEKTRIAAYKKEKAALVKKFGISENLRRVIEISEVFTHIQDKRKEGVLRGNCLFYEALAAVAMQSGIDRELIFYITPSEFFDAEKFSAIDWNEIRLRREKGALAIFCADECYVLPRAEYEKIVPLEHFFGSPRGAVGLVDGSGGIREVRGTVAYKGLVRGIARVVSSVAEIQAFNEGDILIANQTTPEYVPAMKKAAALVTDQGGITCHAAIIAREMKKPCIIGTKFATRVIKSGDRVEVDADKGTVRILDGNCIDLSGYEIIPEGARASYFYISEIIANYIYAPDPAWPINTLMILQHKDARWKIYFVVKDETHFQHFLQRFVTDPHLMVQLEDAITERRDIPIAKIKEKDIARISDSELSGLLQFYYKATQDLHKTAMTLRILDRASLLYFKELFSKTPDADVRISALAVSHRKTFTTQEQIAMLSLAKEIKFGVLKPGSSAARESLEKIMETFSTLTLGYYNEKAKTREDYEEALKEFTKKDPVLELQKMEKQFSAERARQEAVYQSLSREARAIADIAANSTYLKDYFKFSTNKLEEAGEPIFQEIAKRTGVAGEVIKNLSHEDAAALVTGKGYDPERAKQYLKNSVFVRLTGTTNEWYTGAIADRFEEKYLGNEKNNSGLYRGRSACRGFVKGRAKVIHSSDEFLKVNKGDIIIVMNTSPDFVPLFSKIGAIVAEEGGLTAHVSVISRELNIPAVVGIHGITKHIKDGDYVEVDADNGIVRIINP